MAGIGKYKKGAKFTLKSGNAPSYKMMGSTSPFDMVGDEMVERARKSKARTDLLKQLTPEEKAKYDALSGKEKFHVSQNTDLSQMRQALGGDEPSMESMAATGAAAGAGARGAMKYKAKGKKDGTRKTRTIDKIKSAGLATLHFLEVGGSKTPGERYRNFKKYYRKEQKKKDKAKQLAEQKTGALPYTGATETMDQNFQGWGKKKKKSEGKIPWSKAPKSGTQARIDFYKKHNLAMDDTTKLKKTKKA
tara:strand:- start:630 stop:1373 length:744 start_codon:yes stop_codon:yes gene_type:complete